MAARQERFYSWDRAAARKKSAASPNHPPFGRASMVCNVIDTRQAYLQKLLKQALIAVGHPEAAGKSHHFSYEMVALSHETARELGCDEDEAAEAGFREKLKRIATAKPTKNPSKPKRGKSRV